MKPANSILSGYGTTIFTVMSQMAVEYDAVNLGQGFPDVDGPEDIRKHAADSLMMDSNQYPPMMGLPDLRQAVADHNRRFYDLDIDWQSEVMVTSGATEALADAIFGLIEPGDEVVLIEPLYDCYLPLVRRAGGIPKTVRIEPPAWDLDQAALAGVFSEKTKLLILNNPMNPAAKVFNGDELAFIAGLLQQYDAYALCDEVYEHLVFDGRAHIPLMTLPGMRERCVRVGSAGKTFSLTGWKIGYITAPANLLQPIAKAHQFFTFTTPPNLQKAVAYGLRQDDGYYRAFQADLEAKRDLLASGLKAQGWWVPDSQGTYFVSADITPFARESEDDVAFCTRLTQDVGVAAVPISAFYDSDAPRSFIRFCFCKREPVLQEALEKLSVLNT
ncbi:aminotransferase [Aestuariispira insulae]|uniref:Aspartate/methionine/tyrosine aminotransferase n=1 Tax=Aestuariispira insulae TaxID=1461337 RepID=A0A3D9HKN0_9PROT|nr:aminotransferase [Aestuariispira insulae]RED49975.1 aspartate/methionine/tyrosine aminotransferase [Aestuariispira insulae]